MSTMREIGLTRIGSKLRLTVQPVTTLESLRTDQEFARENTDIPAGDTSFGQAAQGTSLDIGVNLSPNASSFAEPKVLDNGEQYTFIGCDSRAKQLVVDRTHSGVTDFSPRFPARSTAPLSPDSKGQVHLRIIVDTHSVEVFAADGTLVITQTVYPEQDITGVSLYTEDDTARPGSLSLWRLGPVQDADAPAKGSDSSGTGKPAVQGSAHSQARAAAASTSPTTATADKNAFARFPLARIGTSLTLGALGAATVATGAYTLRLRRQHS